MGFMGNKIGMKTRDISSVFSHYNSVLFPNITSPGRPAYHSPNNFTAHNKKHRTLGRFDISFGQSGPQGHAKLCRQRMRGGRPSYWSTKHYQIWHKSVQSRFAETLTLTLTIKAMGKMRNCGMRKVKCEIKNAV